jgi:large subunit ribosomal protein L3
MGYDRKTVQNLEVVMIDKQDNLIIVKGAVPGPKHGLVSFKPAVKMHGAKNKRVVSK